MSEAEIPPTEKDNKLISSHDNTADNDPTDSTLEDGSQDSEIVNDVTNDINDETQKESGNEEEVTSNNNNTLESSDGEEQASLRGATTPNLLDEDARLQSQSNSTDIKENPEDISQKDKEVISDKIDKANEEEDKGSLATSTKASKPPVTTDNESIQTKSEENNDMASNAAIALAAVAAAATANNSSPSAAAEAARALAPDLVPEATISALSVDSPKKTMTRVSLDQVRDNIPKSNDKSIQQRLASGCNDAFLQHLLALQYFRVTSDTDKIDNDDNQENPQNQDVERSVAIASAEKATSLLTMAEDAYDAVCDLLPTVRNRERLDTESSDVEYFGIEAPLVVPDLLPPCTSSSGDATLQFFEACHGFDVEDKREDNNDDASSINTKTTTASTNTALSQSSKAESSVFSTMFSSMARTGTRMSANARPSPFTNMLFRKKSSESAAVNDNTSSSKESSSEENTGDGEYEVSIDKEMLGLTVENVLERTVVRTVLPNGAAKKAGAKVGSLIVKVGNVQTRNLTHFETIDELRQSQRPLKLVLRQISTDAVRLAREEMGRLIRGGGFGTALSCSSSSTSASSSSSTPPTQDQTKTDTTETRHEGKPKKVIPFCRVLHQRWGGGRPRGGTKKYESLLQASENLVLILTLLIVGLEKEVINGNIRKAEETSSEDPSSQKHASHTGSSHSAEDYADAAKSVSKVLLDFVNLKLLSSFDDSGDTGKAPANKAIQASPAPPAAGRGGRGKPRLSVAVNSSTSTANSQSDSRTLLLRIGDVLHRTRTFLADPASPPAALLRGEVIAFLCKLLEIDTEMALSEEDESSTAEDAGPVSDLGAAGSLLKLIILNCSMMRSPECAAMSIGNDPKGDDLIEEERRRFGRKRSRSGLDLHRLHAGNRFLAIVHRLAASRSMSARVTACNLGPILWGHLDFPHQLQLRGVITRALHDVDIVVRKSTAAVLHGIAELVFDSRAVPWLVLMCERAMTDPEPQLRAAAMTLTWHLAEHLPNAFLGDASQGSRSLRRLPPRTDPTFAEVYLLQCKLLPVATRLAEDRSFSVRLAVAAQCDRLCNALGDHWYSVIIDMLQALLSDSDERVRREAVLCVPRLAEIVLVAQAKNDAPAVLVLEALLPHSVKLERDPNPMVKIALGSTAGELLTLLVGLESGGECSEPKSTRYKKHVDETLIPLLQNLLHDKDPEVTSAALRAVSNASRGTVREIRSHKGDDDAFDTLSMSSFHSLSSLEKREPVFVPLLSEEQVERLLPTLSTLASNKQWRVRQGAVEIVPALMGCTNKMEIKSEVARLCSELMNDRVDAVRRTAAECLCLSGGGLGSNNGADDNSWEWVAIVLPHVMACSQSKDSKQRILALKMIEVLLVNGLCAKESKYKADTKSTKASMQNMLIKLAASLAADRVPNVRLSFGRLAGLIFTHLEGEEDISLLIKTLQEQIEKECSLERGGDRDVIYFAQRSLVQINNRGEDAFSSATSLGK